jgi:hypothetical protein
LVYCYRESFRYFFHFVCTFNCLVCSFFAKIKIYCEFYVAFIMFRIFGTGRSATKTGFSLEIYVTYVFHLGHGGSCFRGRRYTFTLFLTNANKKKNSQILQTTTIYRIMIYMLIPAILFFTAMLITIHKACLTYTGTRVEEHRELDTSISDSDVAVDVEADTPVVTTKQRWFLFGWLPYSHVDRQDAVLKVVHIPDFTPSGSSSPPISIIVSSSASTPNSRIGQTVRV